MNELGRPVNNQDCEAGDDAYHGREHRQPDLAGADESAQPVRCMHHEPADPVARPLPLRCIFAERREARASQILGGRFIGLKIRTPRRDRQETD